MDNCLIDNSDIFCLPDLGEGLPDAEIYEWFVKEGDIVNAFQPMVSMETAKAVVDVPCPQAGTIAKIYGKPGDLIKTGAPLVAFKTQNIARENLNTVVGHLEETNTIDTDSFTIGFTDSCRIKTTPAVRLKASQLGLDLKNIRPTGENHVITMQDLELAALSIDKLSNNHGFETLSGVRRSMYNSMVTAHKEPVSVTIYDEADLHLWQPKTDITVRLIRALQIACKQEPALNAWVDSKHCARQCLEKINVGLAMDHDNQLFVPVIHDIASLTDEEIRLSINNYKKLVQNRTLNTEHFKNATITLSNFGRFGGKFASPIIVPPTVAIIAVGRIYQGVVVEKSGNVAAHTLAPLSLSFDHRVITGGEATRFLSTMIQHLEQPNFTNYNNR